jgi:hypothetical protein
MGRTPYPTHNITSLSNGIQVSVFNGKTTDYGLATLRELGMTAASINLYTMRCDGYKDISNQCENVLMI